MDNVSKSLFGKPKFNPGDMVRISMNSKSKYKDAIGIVQGYCKGLYTTICNVKLWNNKVIKIFDENLSLISVNTNKTRRNKMYNSSFFDTVAGQKFVVEVQESLHNIVNELRRANDLKERELIALEKSQNKSNEPSDILKVRPISVEIIDVFEGWLDKKGFKVPDENRTGDELEACLYGRVYFDFEDWVTGKLTDFFQTIIDEGYATDEAKVMADAIFDEFFRTILLPFFSGKLTANDVDLMSKKIKEIINSYAIDLIDNEVTELNTADL